MNDVRALQPGRDVTENLELARRWANIGDVSHTIFYAQEAVCLSVESLAAEIVALRRELHNIATPAR
ncbi:MAG: hypothetical protein AB7T59_16105 [Hyphomonadaceae bacterium]